MKCFCYLMIVIFTNLVLAQDITSKLGASGNYDVTDSSDDLLFRVQADKGAIFYGTWGSGTIPQEGDGVRMMWYPNKAAFRAGSIVSGNQWDETNIGQNSVAMGRNTQASGWYSTALGNGTVASGTYSTALGASTLATNNAATAMGANSESSGFYSLAAGYGTKATGTAALAVGWHTIANANNSTALGNYVSIDGYEGSFIVGDNSTTNTTEVTTSNQMVARFASGYTFYTNSSGTLGATLPANGGSWAAPSDSTKKREFPTSRW